MSSTKMSQDAKKDEFRKYLDNAGVLELLTKSLVQLYEEPEKPTDAVNYLKKTVGGSADDKTEIEKLRDENAQLKAKVANLEASQTSLQARLTDLESLPSAAVTETPAAVDPPQATPAMDVTNDSPEEAIVAAPSVTEEVPTAAVAEDTPAPVSAEEKPVEKPEEIKETEEPMETEVADPTPAATEPSDPTAAPTETKLDDAEASVGEASATAAEAEKIE